MKKELFIKILIFGIIVLLISASVASAEIQLTYNIYSNNVSPNNVRSFKDNNWTFYPTDDTFIGKLFPHSNFGSYNWFKIERYEGYFDELDALLKFNVSSVPSGANISATLYIYYFAYDLDPHDREYSIYRINNDWDEDIVTWENQPSYVSTPTYVSIVPSSIGVWMEFDVTDDVQNFINGNVTNHGWIISDDDDYYPNGERAAYFSSKEFGDFVPYLYVKEPTTIYVDDDNTEGPWDGTQEYPYQHIQDGVDNCFLGDTIYVSEGTYRESVRIDEKNINLIGQNRNTTIIDGGGADWVVLFVESINNVTISGFTIQNSKNDCVMLDFISSYNTITGNKIINNCYGITMRSYSNNNIISDNIFINNSYSVYAGDRVFYTTISNNTILNGDTGIDISSDSDNNLITGNTVTNHETGIQLTDSCENIVVSENILENNKFGLYLESNMNYIRIYRNIITENQLGIVLSGLYYSNICYNTIDSNLCGILFYFDNHDVDVYKNDIKNNIYFSGGGLRIMYSWDNNISCNNFINNNPNARIIYSFGIKNTWKQNYWDKPRNSPYLIFGRIGVIYAFMSLWVNFDWHPAQEPYDIGV